MRLWTIQPASVLEQVQRHGVARVVPERRSTPDFVPPAFLWLNRQLESRIKGYGAVLPWWGYCRKPDLRRHRWGRLPGGSRQVRIELSLGADEVVDFQIWAWDRVFCEKYLGTRAQEQDWKRRLRKAGYHTWDELPEPFRLEQEKSWLRLFGPLPARKNAVGEWGTREAVFGEIRREQIVGVTPFPCPREE